MIDHSGAIKIACWFLLLISTGVVTACLLTRWHFLKKNVFPLGLLLATLISSIVAGVFVSLAATQGLGNPLADGSSPDMQKAIYISQIFYFLSIGLGKLSVVAFIYIIFSGTGRMKVTLLLIEGSLVLWTVSMLVAISLQCHPPEVWNLMSGTCVHVTAIWMSFGITNIVLEALLIMIPSVIVFRLQMKLQKRMVVIGCFGLRVLDIIVSAIQLQYAKAFSAETPLPVDLWPWLICCQVLQTTTIVSACVPYLREFLEAFPSGMLQPAGFVFTESRNDSYNVSVSREGGLPEANRVLRV